MTPNPIKLVVSDNDQGEITVTLGGKEVRGWSYKNEVEHLTKMLCAREYVEGWYDGTIHILREQVETGALNVVVPHPSLRETNE